MPHSTTSTTALPLSSARSADDAPHGLVSAAFLPGECHVCVRILARACASKSVNRSIGPLPPLPTAFLRLLQLSLTRSRVAWMDARLTTTDAWCLECTLIHHEHSSIARTNNGESYTREAASIPAAAVSSSSPIPTATPHSPRAQRIPGMNALPHVYVRMCVGRFTYDHRSHRHASAFSLPLEGAGTSLSLSLILWLPIHDRYRASSSYVSSSSSCASSACSVARAAVLAFELEARAANADRQGVYLCVVYVVYRRRSLD
ncbi:unnamed protein product [Hydatigera taeniaeformis]|uniref:Uncharacterized protein n=1 Tax=Hydatigena taeniaeformis TaxID=6205 RepID=A0A158RDM1_HYDTA|nr:unnamed protein product [Hydatigera taeniaeformis]